MKELLSINPVVPAVYIPILQYCVPLVKIFNLFIFTLYESLVSITLKAPEELKSKMLTLFEKYVFI